LEELVKKGKVAGYKIRHAQMLLKADQGKQGPGWQDKQIAEAFGAHLTTVERLRKRLVEQGLKVELSVIDSISHMTVSRTLKKTNSSLG